MRCESFRLMFHRPFILAVLKPLAQSLTAEHSHLASNIVFLKMDVTFGCISLYHGKLSFLL